MRISLLEKRENFYDILSKTLESSHLISNNSIKKLYYVNKYLNFISSPSLPNYVFENLVNEYSYSLTIWKRFFQKSYVDMATSQKFRGFFSHKKILIPTCFEQFLILGGNHRIRLFKKDLKSSYVILKHGESSKFIENDIKLRGNISLSYAPKILNYGNNWIEEEYLRGFPLNRINNKKKSNQLEKVLLNMHLNELLVYCKTEISNTKYRQIIFSKIENILNNKNFISMPYYIDNIRKTLSILLDKLTEKEVAISWSHGDFQYSNVLVDNDKLIVIDWESADKRFYLYDLFVFFGQTRSSIPLSKSIHNFENKCLKLGFNIDFKKVILCLIEELKYLVTEDFSENFSLSGKKANSFCNSVLNFLNE